MAETIALVWHRLWAQAPAERRAVAPWKLTGLDGSPVYGRVQKQDGSWQGQVIVNSIPADWRKSHKGTSFPSEWHSKRDDAFASVETFLGAHARSIFGVDDLTILTWDDSDPDDKTPEPVKITGKEGKVILMDEVFDTPLMDKLKTEAQREISRHHQQLMERIASDVLKPYQKDFVEWAKKPPLSSGDLDKLKKYWG